MWAPVRWSRISSITSWGGGAADIGLGTGAETFSRRHAHLDDAFGPRHGQGLGIRVGDDEVDALEAGIDHVVDGVAARAADAEYGYPRLQLANVRDVEINGHGCLSDYARVG